ncbi:hypothetical protein MCOR29_010910 [Pyricularia oryzae]|nr:hypothetical protein MCOR29_010910 [Pyricularia oryzae]KAI6324021.1 hypothetical protein MCOR34_001588 [Pyricularia oryzae]KAI6455031.1 hypothetical protein MCOR17_008824 [Pyricularia oryzae]KAI6507231.1 hypothetical protein MCOR13_002835 [Pyricularia oryzae]KAI6592529.1 hypothetical protein MCOR04_003531 [Pyricularia oryzae]
MEKIFLYRFKLLRCLFDACTPDSYTTAVQNAVFACQHSVPDENEVVQRDEDLLPRGVDPSFPDGHPIHEAPDGTLVLPPPDVNLGRGLDDQLTTDPRATAKFAGARFGGKDGALYGPGSGGLGTPGTGNGAPPLQGPWATTFPDPNGANVAAPGTLPVEGNVPQPSPAAPSTGFPGEGYNGDDPPGENPNGPNKPNGTGASPNVVPPPVQSAIPIPSLPASPGAIIDSENCETQANLPVLGRPSDAPIASPAPVNPPPVVSTTVIPPTTVLSTVVVVSTVATTMTETIAVPSPVMMTVTVATPSPVPTTITVATPTPDWTTVTVPSPFPVTRTSTVVVASPSPVPVPSPVTVDRPVYVTQFVPQPAPELVTVFAAPQPAIVSQPSVITVLAPQPAVQTMALQTITVMAAIPSAGAGQAYVNGGFNPFINIPGPGFSWTPGGQAGSFPLGNSVGGIPAAGQLPGPVPVSNGGQGGALVPGNLGNSQGPGPANSVVGNSFPGAVGSSSNGSPPSSLGVGNSEPSTPAAGNSPNNVPGVIGSLAGGAAGNAHPGAPGSSASNGPLVGVGGGGSANGQVVGTPILGGASNGLGGVLGTPSSTGGSVVGNTPGNTGPLVGIGVGESAHGQLLDATILGGANNNGGSGNSGNGILDVSVGPLADVSVGSGGLGGLLGTGSPSSLGTGNQASLLNIDVLPGTGSGLVGGSRTIGRSITSQDIPAVLFSAYGDLSQSSRSTSTKPGFVSPPDQNFPGVPHTPNDATEKISSTVFKTTTSVSTRTIPREHPPKEDFSSTTTPQVPWVTVMTTPPNSAPGTSFSPSVPKAPSELIVPQTPNVPGSPNIPPNTPRIPVGPSSPGTPNAPNTPVAPGTWNTPNRPSPPGVPGIPNTPVVPGTWNTPGVSSSPRPPGLPGTPGQPNAPFTPNESELWSGFSQQAPGQTVRVWTSSGSSISPPGTSSEPFTPNRPGPSGPGTTGMGSTTLTPPSPGAPPPSNVQSSPPPGGELSTQSTPGLIISQPLPWPQTWTRPPGSSINSRSTFSRQEPPPEGPPEETPPSSPPPQIPPPEISPPEQETVFTLLTTPTQGTVSVETPPASPPFPDNPPDQPPAEVSPPPDSPPAGEPPSPPITQLTTPSTGPVILTPSVGTETSPQATPPTTGPTPTGDAISAQLPRISTITPATPSQPPGVPTGSLPTPTPEETGAPSPPEVVVGPPDVSQPPVPPSDAPPSSPSDGLTPPGGGQPLLISTIARTTTFTPPGQTSPVLSITEITVTFSGSKATPSPSVNLPPGIPQPTQVNGSLSEQRGGTTLTSIFRPNSTITQTGTGTTPLEQPPQFTGNAAKKRSFGVAIITVLASLVYLGI